METNKVKPKSKKEKREIYLFKIKLILLFFTLKKKLDRKRY